MSTIYRVLYRTADGEALRNAGPEVMVAFPIVELLPVRDVNNFHGQQHRTGYYASRKAGRSLKFESGTERLRMMFLDFDPTVTTYTTQPFTLTWDRDGKTYHYTPDLLIVRPGRERTVEDVKPPQFRNSSQNAPAFEAAREAFPPVGLTFNLWSPPSAVLCYNVRHLAGYRRTPVYMPTISREILARTADGPMPLAELAEATGHHMLTRPVIFHLLWTHRLHTDLEQPLSQNSLIYRSEPGWASEPQETPPIASDPYGGHRYTHASPGTLSTHPGREG